MIAVVDYGMGNLRSVANALAAVGGDVRVTRDADDLRSASHIVLPGVGGFGDCAANLRASGLVDALDEEVRQRGKHFLGICLGMQLLAAGSEEAERETGLGWWPGTVRRFREDAPLRVPHMGWNDVEPVQGSPMFRGIRDPAFFFVHSYYLPADTASVAATCEYGGPFTAAVVRDNIWATQFHPEKSQQNGLRLLENFLGQ